MTMTGVETSTLMAGRWLVTEWTSDMMGQPFEGHGVAGWDPAKKAYVSVWVDSMNTELTFAESTYDPETDSLTGWMEMPDPMGGEEQGEDGGGVAGREHPARQDLRPRRWRRALHVVHLQEAQVGPPVPDHRCRTVPVSATDRGGGSIEPPPLVAQGL